MELSEEREQSPNQPVDLTPAQTAVPSPVRSTGTTTPSYVYALGRVTPRFPSLAVEKEFAQATGRAETAGLTDSQALQSVLSQRSNRYLARQLCWVLEIEGLETYLLVPRDPADFDLLVEALRPTPSPMDIDVVVGIRGPIAPPEMCNGLMIPIVAFDQIYSFDRDTLIKAIPRPQKVTAKEFEPTASELFDRIMQMADNAGAMDEDRALNYLAVRYPLIYATAADAFGRNESLTSVTVRPSSLSGTRNIADVIFSYTNRNTDVTEKFFVRVDVTEEFPFLFHETVTVLRSMKVKTKLKGANKMQIPGFTAESSLYKSGGYYYTHGTSNQGRASILPALGAGPGGDCFDNCDLRRCSNLDGDALLRCEKRCSDICFPTGPSTGPNIPSFGGPCEKGFLACELGCLFSLDVGCADACIAAYTACTLLS